MEETMGCLLGALHGNQRRSGKVLRGCKRRRVPPWASQRLRAKNRWREGDAARGRQSRFDQFSWPGALTERR